MKPPDHWAPGVNPQLVERLYQACQDQSLLELEYLVSRYDEVPRLEHYWIEAECLIFGQSSAFFVGQVIDDKRVKTFILNRIQDALVLKPLETQLKQDRESFLKALQSHLPQEVVLEIFDPLASSLEHFRWHPSQVNQRKDHSMIARFKAPIEEGLIRWLLSLGSECVVRSPTFLSERMARKAEALSKHHRRKKAA